MTTRIRERMNALLEALGKSALPKSTKERIVTGSPEDLQAKITGRHDPGKISNRSLLSYFHPATPKSDLDYARKARRIAQQVGTKADRRARARSIGATPYEFSAPGSHRDVSGSLARHIAALNKPYTGK